MRYRKFSLEFKKNLVEEIKSGALTIAQAVRQHELSPTLIYRWRDQYEHGKLNNKPTERGAFENKIAELERKVGQQAMEIDLLKKARERYLRDLNEKRSAFAVKELLSGGAKS